jgi:anti-sigma B factor antagonist
MIQDFSVAIQSPDHHGSLVAVVRGELDMLTAPILDAELEQATAQGPRTLVIEMSGVTFLDSSGCHALVRAHRRSDTTGVELYLAGLNGTCRRVLEVAGLTELLPLRDA